MSEDHAQLVKQVFQRVVDCAPADRETILAEACHGDTALRQKVTALLGADGCVREQFLAGPTQTGHDELPERIGSYQIIRRIGEGGMGVVFEAVQENPRRHVALKLLKSGLLSADALRRFEYEAQVLANLLHPGIAQVYEAGTASIAGGNVPFFAMELVPGARPITEHARADQPDTRQRLLLFADVCDAVHHGHQRGVIHRDLKPSNIVVDSNGRPRIIDFGVARSAAGDATFAVRQTSAGQIIGTLPYMSPEQASGGGAGRDDDVRSDVYSLGVVLYELLCGRLPYDVGQGNLLEAARIIREQAPARPSAVHRILRGDLETIVLKALDKDRGRRYQTAGDLARDIRHYLADEPIEARGDSTFYLLRKNAARYRVAIAVLLGFVVLISASTIIAWTLMLRSRESEHKARDHLRESLVAQARAIRHTGRVGQRYGALDALTRAAAIAPSLEARNEAIAAMALPDLRLVRRLPYDGTGFCDTALERCADVHADGSITLVHMADDKILARIPAPAGGMEEFHWATITGRFLIRLYDPPTGDRRLEVWTVPEGRIHFQFNDVPRLARHDVSPDGKRLAVGRTDRAVHIYDLESGIELQRVPLDRIPSYVTFDPSGRRIVLYHANYSDARILDLETGASRPAFESRNIGWSVAWHPEGKLLAGATATQVEVWNSESGARVAVLNEHEQPVVHVAFSRDASVLLTYSWEGRSILWDVQSLRPLFRIPIHLHAFNATGDKIVVRRSEGPRNQNEIYEFEPGLQRTRLVGSKTSQNYVASSGAFHPQTGLLFMAERSETGPTEVLRVFDVAGRQELARCDVPGLLPRMRVDPAGRFVLTACRERLFRWPIRSEQARVVVGPPQLIHSGGNVANLQLSGDGRYAIVHRHDEPRFAVIDLQSDNHVRLFPPLPHANQPCLSPDGHWAALGTWRGTSGEVWDLRSGARAAELPLNDTGSFAFSPDNKWLASSDVKSVCLRETGSWRLVREVPGYGPVRYSPDGRLLATLRSFTSIQLLNPATFDEIATLESPESFQPADFEFSADGARLAYFTNHAGLAFVWDLRRIRAGLAPIGLDWDLPTYPPEDIQNVLARREVTIDPGELGVTGK